MCVCTCGPCSMNMRKSKLTDNFWKLVLSCHHVGSRNQNMYISAILSAYANRGDWSLDILFIHEKR